MKLVSITPVRNEGWVLGLSLRALLRWVDEAVVLVHASTDDSLEIASRVAAETGRVTIRVEDDPVWREMEHRQRLLELARSRGATHIAPVDADEVLTGDWLRRIRGQLTELPMGRFASIPMRNLHRSIYRYRSDAGIWGKRAGTMLAFRDAPSLCWSAVNGYDHHHRAPSGSRQGPRLVDGGGLMHLQFASWRRLTAKHALYKMVERIRWPHKAVAEIDRLYSLALNESGAETAAVPAAWWAPYADLLPHLRLDAEPWQEREARRLWDVHGPAPFERLNLFRVVSEAPVDALQTTP
jgi:hypothetical protein